MPGEFLQQFSSSEWLEKADRTSSHLLAVQATMKNDLSYHNLSVEDATELALSDHSGSYWQQAELCTELVQAEQWCWRWWCKHKPEIKFTGSCVSWAGRWTESAVSVGVLVVVTDSRTITFQAITFIVFLRCSLRSNFRLNSTKKQIAFIIQVPRGIFRNIVIFLHMKLIHSKNATRRSFYNLRIYVFTFQFVVYVF